MARPRYRKDDPSIRGVRGWRIVQFVGPYLCRAQPVVDDIEESVRLHGIAGDNS